MNDLPTQPWTIRPYQSGDEATLVELFEQVNGRPLSLDHWFWKLQGLPSPAPNVWLALVDGLPVCQYAGLPLPYQLPDGETTAMVTVDVMTDPEWRRQGVLTAVAGQTFAAWSEAGVPFTIGTPNERMGSRTRAIGYRPFFPLRWYIRPLRPGAVAGRRLLRQTVTPGDEPSLGDRLWNRWWNRVLPHDPSLKIERVRIAAEAFDTLWELCVADKPLSIIRDRAWVAWRFLAAPEIDYHLYLAWRNGRPVGYVVTRLTEEDGVVKGVLVEWLAPRVDSNAIKALVRHAVDDLADRGAQSVATQAIPGSAEHRLLRQAGFVGRAAFTVWINPFEAHLPLEIYGDGRQWRMSGGDFDVV